MKIWFKLLWKDFLRIRWPRPKKTAKYFLYTIIFVTISVGFLFGVDIGFSTLWNHLHVGING